MLTSLLRLLCVFLGALIAIVAGLATGLAVCAFAVLAYIRFSEGRLGESDARLLAWATRTLPIGALLTCLGVFMTKAFRRRDVGRSPSFRLAHSPHDQTAARVCLVIFWIILVGVWSATHLPGEPGWPRVFLTAGLLATVFAAMHARLVLHEFAHLFAGRLCGLKPLGLRVGCGPRLSTGESRGGFRWEWRLWPAFGWAESMHFDERSFRWRQFLMIAAGPLADALFVAGGWWLLVHPGHDLLGRAILTPAGSLAPDSFPMVFALYAVFAPSMLLGLLPRRVIIGGGAAFSDGWWLAKVFFLPAMAVREFMGRQKYQYAIRLWKGGRREASREQMSEAQALFPEYQTAFALLESRLHEESDEPGPAGEHLQHALELSDELALTNRLPILTEHIAALAASEKAERARQIAETLLARSATPAEKVETLDWLACLPILHQGTSALLTDAERWCAEARALAPESVTLRGTWGALLVEANREEEAVPILEEVMATTGSDNDRGIGSFYLALAARRAGRRKEMLRHRQGTLRWCKVPALLARIPAELPAT